MKRGVIALLFVGLLAISSAVYGFDFSAGFKLGLNLPFSTAAALDKSMLLPSPTYPIMIGAPGGIPPIRFCMTAGGFMTFGIVKLIAIQPELLYTMTGWATKDPASTIYYHLAVIELPILVRLRLYTKRDAIFSFFLGPDLQFPIAFQTAERTAGGVETTSDIYWLQDKSGDAYNPFTFIFGLMAGIGFEAPNGVLIEARYYLGFLKTDPSYDWSSVSWNTFDPRNRTWTVNSIQVLFGVSF